MKSIFTKTVYPSDIITLNYAYSSNYILDSYRYIYYNLTKDGDSIPELNLETIAEGKWGRYNISDDIIAGGTIISSSIVNNQGGAELDLSIFKSVGLNNFDNGKYTLTTLVVVSAEPLHLDNNISEDVWKACERSPLLSNILDILAANTITVQVTKSVSEVVSTSDFINIDFLPKTNIGTLVAANNLTASCKIAYKTAEDNIVITNTQDILCTHGVGASWQVGRLLIPEDGKNEGGTTDIPRVPFELTIECKPTGVTSDYNTVIYKVAFHLEKALGEGATYINDETLVCCFDTINEGDMYIQSTNTWKSSVNNNFVDYGIQFYNVTGSTGKVYDSESESDIIKLNAKSFGILYQESKNYGTPSGKRVPYNPFNMLTVASGSEGVGLTVETYVKSRCIGELSSKALSLRNDFKGDGVASPGVSIGYDGLSAEVEGKLNSYPLLEDSWQHIAITFGTDVNTSDRLALKPYPLICVYVNGVMVRALDFTYKDGTSFV
jgi:hypothetical protein